MDKFLYTLILLTGSIFLLPACGEDHSDGEKRKEKVTCEIRFTNSVYLENGVPIYSDTTKYEVYMNNKLVHSEIFQPNWNCFYGSLFSCPSGKQHITIKYGDITINGTVNLEMTKCNIWVEKWSNENYFLTVTSDAPIPVDD